VGPLEAGVQVIIRGLERQANAEPEIPKAVVVNQ
jgi:hypothetical protein